jgi:hypothetical protein
MNIYISANKDTQDNGYVNINFNNGINNWKETLDVTVSDAEATVIIIDGLLSCLPMEEAILFLHTVSTKLRHGGTLIIHSVNIYEVAKDFYQYKLTVQQFNELIYGVQSNHKFGITLAALEKFCSAELGLNVVRKTINNYHYVLEVQRP